MTRVRDAEVGLADLIASVERLAPKDDALLRRIAEMLQFEVARPAVVAPMESPPRPRPGGVPEDAKKIEPFIGKPPADLGTIASTLEKRRSEAETFIDTIPALPPATAEAQEAPLPFDPLFVPGWTRAIVSLALSTPAAHGAVDIRRVTERLSRGEAILRLPRRITPTMRKGVQVLVDRGSGMVPFFRDQDWLVREIVRVAGQETPVLQFRGLPSRGVSDVRRRRRLDYTPPAVGVPVVLLTDFGIGVDTLATDRATTREWLEFLRSVRRTDSAIIAFVPYPRRRCPAAIAAAATIITWDRGTTLTRIRAAVRKGWVRR
ncbi:MAG TPA: hypothetical protein VND45_10220 [Thermoanaerobaculia bacterium]|jgi:hypothetical protein|nr:hypothetical protein [Thermoanaerobaculia bacterium]